MGKKDTPHFFIYFGIYKFLNLVAALIIQVSQNFDQKICFPQFTLQGIQPLNL